MIALYTLWSIGQLVWRLEHRVRVLSHFKKRARHLVHPRARSPPLLGLAPLLACPAALAVSPPPHLCSTPCAWPCATALAARVHRTRPNALPTRRRRSLAVRSLLPPGPLRCACLACDSRAHSCALGSSGPECCLLHHIRLRHCPTTHLLACSAHPNQCRHCPEHVHAHRLHGLHCFR